MFGWVRTAVISAFSLLFLLITVNTLSAENSKGLTSAGFSDLLPGALLTEQSKLQLTYRTHRFVALPATSLLSPDPDQLRVQDLRNIECYAQPDALEVCGAGDTIPIMLFTKSVPPLQDIRLDVVFEDGIEYGGFAYVDNTLANSGAQLDTISTENPESPSFLLDQVSEATGGVIVYLGVRAECGVDFSINNPDVTINFSYTNADGVACTGSVTLEDYGGNVIIPKVVITNDPPNLNLNRPGNIRCHSLDVSQSTINASATGYIFTASNYGFEEGISIVEVRRAGNVLAATDYTIDAVTGEMTLTVTDPTADGFLDFNEIETINVCYTYTECFPNVDFTPVYTAVSACDGVFCTGPVDQRSAGELRSNFPQNPAWQAEIVGEQLPDVCTGQPYVLDIELGAAGDLEITDQMESINLFLRRCKNPGLFLDTVALVSLDGATILGVFDESIYSVRGEDQVTASTGVPTANRAGTVTLDLRQNDLVSGGGLTDTDGDGFFDDMPGDESIRLRFVFGVACASDELACNSGANLPGGPDAGADCQFREISLSGRTGCDTRNRTATLPLLNLQNFDAESTSEYTNEETFTFGGSMYSGYDFGEIGRSTMGGPLNATTKPINFSYTLGDNDLFACDPVGTGVAKLELLITGNEYLLDNMEFTDIAFNGMTVSPGKVTVARPMTGELLFTVDTGSVMSGVPFDYDFSVTLDTPRCAPPALLFVDAFLTTQCADGCDCAPVRTCTSTTFTVDPDSLGCVCEYTISTFVKRVNTNFEDETRTTEVDPETISQQDIRRFVSGDTLEILYQLTVEPGADPDFNESNEFLDFRTDLRVTGGASATSQNFQAMFDLQTARVQSFTINRKDGTEIDVGASISGDINVGASGVLINSGGDNTFGYGINEPEMAGLPNGGYTFGTGNSSNDDLDGRLLRLQVNNLNGQPDANTPFFDLVGGRFIGEDTINIVWHVVLVDNPSWNGMVSTMSLTGLVDSRGYIGDPADNVIYNTDGNQCSPTSEPFQYADPMVEGSSRIEYTDDCEATLVVSYDVTGIPSDWYTNEYRLVAGIEEFDINFPEPYYYAGGATVETGGLSPVPVEPTGSSNVDTATVNGQQVLFPNGTGILSFVDAEKADGVRPDGYAGYGGPDEALSDVITVGGTYPLLGFMGGAEDSLVFRIPLVRGCSAEATSGGGLSLNFDAANLHLPDLFSNGTFQTSGSASVDGEVLDNDGNVVQARRESDGAVSDPPVTGSRFYPFLRLEDSPQFLPGFPINRERRINNVVAVTETGARPTEIVSAASVGMDFLTDDMGTETNTYMLCPDGGEILPGGALSIELSNSVELLSISGDATSFSIASATDSSIFYAVEIPAENVADDCFEITLTTDLLFCDAGMVCMTPILGCPGSQIDITQQVNVYKEFMLECSPAVCYEYRGGTTEVDISFNLPTQSDLCSDQTYSILYVNNGSGSLSDLQPVIQIPTGLDVDFSSFEITLIGGGTMALSPPVANPDSNTIYGSGYVFDQTEIDAFLSPNEFEVGDIIEITFDAATSCDFINGTPLAARLNAADACQQPQYIMDTTSDPIRVATPDVPEPLFELDLPELIQVSCSESGTELLITTLNVGKAPTTELEVMFTLPAGFSLEADDVVVVAPSDFVIDDIVEEDLGGGVTMYSFTGPESIAIGGALCVKVMLNVDGIDCGVYQLSAGFKQATAPLTCPTTMETCTLASLLSESSIFDVEVVPTVTLGTDNEITADCGPTPGTFNIAYDLEIVAPSAAYTGPAAVELYRDANANGTYEPGTDQQLGTTMNINVAIDSGEVASISGMFNEIDVLDVCPVLIRFTVPGCACGESVLSVMDILPTFLNDLGESVALCPGEEGMLTGICAPLDYSFNPVTAGTVTDNGDGTVSFSLNDGFTEAILQVGGTFGVCPVDVSIPVISNDPFEFGPYTAEVCNEGAQEIDFNIPPALQEDLEILILPSIGLDDPTSFEPTISDLQADQVYTVQFTLNGECTAETTLTVTVDQAPMVELTGSTTCITGFDLEDALTISPADLTGEFQTSGDGTFTTGNRVPGATEYIPGPMDREAGSVSFRFVSDDPEGPCGPDVARMDFTILLVDCGNFGWDGSND
ncbi:hypothetical protein SAMN05444359_11116 [Neolewinella agarilytica]|uniref:Uncharacterized protein n=1 Tax=Neolewinella agarilytica TaxID=478744 RepID=A0A1H9GLV1_9BACT|nr:hypothetical protein SAMN05444359_11116 [Neolewinella agarilytica]